MTEGPVHILLVEDNPGDARLLREALAEAAGPGEYEVAHRLRLAEALADLSRRTFDCLLLDLSLPDSVGMNTVERARAAAPQMPVVVLTSLDDEQTGVEALRRGAQDYLIKGQTDGRLLKRTVRYAIERKDMEDQLRHARDELELRVRQRTAELAQTLEALRDEVGQRQRLEKEVLEISAREQRRIGQDLHDSLGQNLTGAAFLTRALQQRLSAQGLPEADDAAEVAEVIKQAVAQARGLARGLCPVEGKADGLAASLADMAAATEQVFGVPCGFACEGSTAVHDPGSATHLYHIAQEAVNNAVKHARPKRIAISLKANGDAAVLRVADDGVGIPAAAAGAKGMGLQIMRYRARLVGGTLDVSAGDGGGTVISCFFPLSRPNS